MRKNMIRNQMMLKNKSWMKFMSSFDVEKGVKLNSSAKSSK